MIVLGIDPAVKKSAVVALEEGKEIFYDYIDSDIQSIVDFLEDNIYDIFILVCEKQYLGVNVKTMGQLLFVRHMWEILSSMSINCEGVYSVAPASWKSFALGKVKKGEGKRKSVEKFRELTQFNLQDEDHDIADAYHIARYGFNKFVLGE